MKKGAWILGLVIVAVLGWRTMRDKPDPKLAFDRFWVDHQAADGNEKFDALFINGARPWGRFGTQTWFRGQREAFHYHVVPRQDGRLKITYPATDQREEVVVMRRLERVA